METEELSPQEKMARRKRAIRKFKAIVRLVIANVFWMRETFETKLTTNVRKNIRLLLKKKTIKSPLTMNEKAILSKPKELRTSEEKELLRKVLSGLKCFRKYPESVKEKLATVTYFSYYAPRRIIVKQDHESLAMYFLITGECTTTRSHINTELNEEVTDEIGALYPGTTFGELGLLHGIKRLTTITTVTDCELLFVKREDFNTILKETVMKDWTEMQQTIDMFPFFNVWSQFTKVECSIVARIKSFEPDETVLGDGVGFTQFVHFIISGNCYILEQIDVKFIIKQGVQMYDYVSDEMEMHDDLMQYANCRKFHQGLSDGKSISSKASRASRSSRVSRISRKSTGSTGTAHFKSQLPKTTRGPNIAPRSSGVSQRKSTFSTASWTSRKTTASQKKRFADEGHENFDDDLSIESSTSREQASFSRSKIRIETHFIKVCEFPKRACFNLGEKMTRRRIIALTPMKCLLVPKTFIKLNNPGYIFDGVLLFLTTHIPSTEKVFAKFVEEAKFKKYRKRLVNELLNIKMVRTNNSINNVPYSIRLTEGLDTEYFNFK